MSIKFGGQFYLNSPFKHSVMPVFKCHLVGNLNPFRKRSAFCSHTALLIYNKFITCWVLFMKLLLSSLLILLSISAFSDDNRALLVPIKKLTDLAMQDDILLHAKKHDGKMDLNAIFSKEDHWIASESKPTHYLNKPLQYYFEGLIQQPGSPFVELILMGSQGETLAAFPTPTDYWQGDEAKFINVMADEQVFIDQLNWDESTQTISAQISVPVKDASGEMFGVLTAGVEASSGSLGNIEAE